MPKKDKFTRLIQEGDQHLREGDLTKAEQKYRKALAKEPNSAEALYSIGSVYTHRGDFQNALEWARLAVTADPLSLPSQALLGNVLLGLHRYEEALEALTLAAQDESDLMARAQMGLCCEALNRWEEAEGYLRAVLENDLAYMTRFKQVALYNQSPFFADVHHALARVLQRQGKLDEAKLHYHLTKRIDPPTQLDPMYLKIMNRTDLENHPVEQVEFEKPSKEAALSEKLVYLLKLADYPQLQEAVQEYHSEDLLSYLVDMINASQHMGEFYMAAQMRMLGDLLTGQEPIDLFTALQSKTWMNVFELAEMVYKEQMSLEEACEEAGVLEFDANSANLLLSIENRFIEVEPETGLILAHLVEQALVNGSMGSDIGASAVLLGKAYYRTRNLERAAESYRKAVDRYEQAHDTQGALVALTRLSEVQSNQNRFSDALTTIDRYLRLAEAQGIPKDVIQGRYHRALILLQGGRTADSFAEGMKIVPMVQAHGAEAALRENLAKLLLDASEKLGQPLPDGILGNLQPAAPHQIETIALLLAQARMAEENGDLDGALSLFEQARNKAEREGSRAELIRVLTDLGTVLGTIGRLAEAEEVLHEADSRSGPISAEVDTWPILINLGILASLQGLGEKAITYFERALQEARIRGSQDREGQSLKFLSSVLADVDPQRSVEHFGQYLQLSGVTANELPLDWVEGMAALDAGHFEKGIAALERLCGDKGSEAQRLHPEALANIGIAYMRLGEVSKAISNWKKAADAWNERGTVDRAVDVLGRVALVLMQESGDYGDVFSRMLNIWEGIENSGLRRSVGVELAGVAFTLEEFSVAERILKEAIVIATSDQWRDIVDEMKARQILGKIYRQTSQYQEAIEQYQKALACALYLKDEQSEGYIRGWMGIAYRYLGDVDMAVEQYRRAITIAERFQDTSGAAFHRFNLAASLFLLGRVEEGKSYALDALTVFDATGENVWASRVLGLLEQEVGWEELPQAVQARLEAAVDEDLRSMDAVVRSRAQSKMALRLASEGDLENALVMLEEVIVMLGERGDCYNQGLSLLNRAHILQRLDSERSMDEWALQKHLWHRSGSELQLRTQLLLDARKARDLALSIKQIHLLVRCEEFLLSEAFRTGNDSQFNLSLNSVLVGYLQIRRRLRNDRDRIRFADRVSEVVGGCVAYLLLRQQTTRAFELLEWKRSQALTDLLTESVLTSSQTNKPEVQNLLAQEARLLDLLQQREIQVPNVLLSAELTSGEGKELERDVESELTDVYEALEAFDPLYVLQKRGIPADMARMRSLLSDVGRTAIVITLDFVDEEVVAFTLRTGQKEPRIHYTGMSRDQIEELLRTFRHEMYVHRGNSSESWYSQAAPLLGEVAEEIARDDLVVLIPQGDLQLLPLHALELPNGQLLIDYAAVVYTPSLTVLEHLQRSHPTVEEPVTHMLLSVGIAFPDEARAVSLTFGKIGMCLSGNSLPKDQLREQLSEFRMVHFACHGYFDSEFYLDSGLVLRTTDTLSQLEHPLRREVLSIRDLMTWHLNSDLIVLSACETGLGVESPSDFLGLSRSLLAAGAHSVMATLWAIDDTATQSFMLTFYRELQQQLANGDRMDIADALRQTQSRLAKENPIYDWAGFKLIGWPSVAWKGK